MAYNPLYIKNISGHDIQMDFPSDVEPYSDIGMKYTFDHMNWSPYIPGVTTPITIPDGQTCYFKGTATWSTCGENFNYAQPAFFLSDDTVKIKVGGALTSLLHDGDDSEDYATDEEGSLYTFSCLFERYMYGTMDVSDLKIPAKIGPHYFESAFAWCHLANIPENFLPATKLSKQCYRLMFQGCIFDNSPERIMSATEIAGEKTCEEMFLSCQGLEKIDLPITNYTAEGVSATSQFGKMLKGCSDLSSITVHFTEWNNSAFSRWVQDVAAEGDFYCPEELEEVFDRNHIPEGWRVHKGSIVRNCFYIENTGSAPITLKVKPQCDYSFNQTDWTHLEKVKAGTPVVVNAGQKCYFKGTGCATDFLDWFALRDLSNDDSIALGGSLQSMAWDGDGNNTLGRKLSDGSHFVFAGVFAGCAAHMDLSNLILNGKFIDESGAEIRQYYSTLFTACRGLTSIPSGLLPSTFLAPGCYDAMFNMCTNLEEVPADLLPATKGAEGAYANMFKGCAKLRRAPDINIEELTASMSSMVMSQMFTDCSSLNEIHVSFKDWAGNYDTYYWVANVAPTGDFYCPEELPEQFSFNAIPNGWRVHKGTPVVVKNCFYIEYAQGNKEQVMLHIPDFCAIAFNSPDAEWQYPETHFYINRGDRVYIRSNGITRHPGEDWFGLAAAKSLGAQKFIVGGSLQSLIWDGDGDNPYTKKNDLGGYCRFKDVFYYSFENHVDIDFSNLILNGNFMTEDGEKVDYYYGSLFGGCHFETIPEGFLPATELTEGCYNAMFVNCKNLKTVPEDLLPATEAQKNCYREMFYNCRKLQKAPIINLENPTAEAACGEMFYGCVELSEIQVPNLTEWSDSFSGWVGNVAYEGDFYCPYELEEIVDISHIPYGWRVHKTEPPVPPPPPPPKIEYIHAAMNVPGGFGRIRLG